MKLEEPLIVKDEPMAARRGEGLMVITQNNDDKTVIITEMNPVLETMLGYDTNEIIGRRIETILGTAAGAVIGDDLEYEDDAPDFREIFSRIRDVKLRRRVGDEIMVTCTLSRLVSQEKNACFQIVVPDEHARVATNKLNEFIALNFEGHKELDPATGLPNQKTAEHFLPLLKNYYADGDVNIVVALLRMDRHDKSLRRYGKDACTQLLLHVAKCCSSTFRDKDLIFALSDSTLGIVLFDISRESARVVLNRLRWKIRNHRIEFGGKSDFSISTCIGFDMLDLEDAPGTLKRCEGAMLALDADERNALLELGNA